jgi:hypothetical protein
VNDPTKGRGGRPAPNGERLRELCAEAQALVDAGSMTHDAFARLVREAGVAANGEGDFVEALAPYAPPGFRFEERPSCPECSSPDVLPFLYGEPEAGVKGSLFGPRPGDDVAIGGCVVSPDAPAWKCRACRNEFGTLGEQSPGMFSEEDSDG